VQYRSAPVLQDPSFVAQPHSSTWGSIAGSGWPPSIHVKSGVAPSKSHWIDVDAASSMTPAASE
jgi:hypothetical protein